MINPTDPAAPAGIAPVSLGQPRSGREGRPVCETRGVGLVLIVCGSTAVAVGGWRSYAVAREALAPLVHEGDPTRTAIEATRPVFDRSRVRAFVRRVAVSVGWLLVAMYGLAMVTAGQGVGS